MAHAEQAGSPGMDPRGGTVIFYGDPHGTWEPLLEACLQDPPLAVVLMGDLGLECPLRETLEPLFSERVPVHWIAGNHDTMPRGRYDMLWEDHPDGNLHGTVRNLGGIRVAGLGGVFKERVWYPRTDEGVARYQTRYDCMASTRQPDRWRDGIPLGVRDAIFPEDIWSLEGAPADILVSHEAPSSHGLGMMGVDMAAHACGARMIIHGHHHRRLTSDLPDGTHVIGLGQAEVMRFRPSGLRQRIERVRTARTNGPEQDTDTSGPRR